jgi:hypothetical protein
MNVNQFAKNYDVSKHLFASMIKKNYILEGIHYKNEFNLHQKKIIVLKPDEVYSIILSKSKIKRKKVECGNTGF